MFLKYKIMIYQQTIIITNKYQLFNKQKWFSFLVIDVNSVYKQSLNKLLSYLILHSVATSKNVHKKLFL